MEAMSKTAITVEATVNAATDKVWKCWTAPEHITQWCNASDDWHAPHATNDLRAGGKFLTRMEAKDKSFGFDFNGIYDQVVPNKLISYSLEDGRKVRIEFISQGDKTQIIEIFDPENENPVEMQKAGWQAILNNFKRYTESQ